MFIPAEPAALAERFAAIPVKAETEPAIAPRAIQEPQPAPVLRPLEREEIAMLVKRSEDLVAQGDIASARLMLTRAAEAGDGRAALALGATYDAGVLRKLGVIGVRPTVPRHAPGMRRPPNTAQAKQPGGSSSSLSRCAEPRTSGRSARARTSARPAVPCRGRGRCPTCPRDDSAKRARA